MCSDHDCPHVRQGHDEIKVLPSTVSRAAIVYHTLDLCLAGLQSTSNQLTFVGVYQQFLLNCRLAAAPTAHPFRSRILSVSTHDAMSSTTMPWQSAMLWHFCMHANGDIAVEYGSGIPTRLFAPTPGGQFLLR